MVTKLTLKFVDSFRPNVSGKMKQVQSLGLHTNAKPEFYAVMMLR